MLAELTLRAGSEISRAAVVVDVREGKMSKEFPRVLPEAAEALPGLNPVLIFLEATERRSCGGSARRAGRTRWRRTGRRSRASARSARRCKPSGSIADHVVDTSAMTVHELRHAFTGVASGDRRRARSSSSRC